MYKVIYVGNISYIYNFIHGHARIFYIYIYYVLIQAEELLLDDTKFQDMASKKNTLKQETRDDK